MIMLCKSQVLPAYKLMDQGMYFGNKKEKVLLPRKEVYEGMKVGDELEVYIYLDSEDRQVATLKRPKIDLRETASLKVTDVTSVGAFLDWGLDKELLLPYREQTRPLNVGDEPLVALYIDKTGRPAATMKVYKYLKTGGDYKPDSSVSGKIVNINEDIGIFVAIDDKYFGLIPKAEITGKEKAGDLIYARVTEVRPDGKYMLSTKQKAYIQMDLDSENILKELKKSGGLISCGDKSDAGEIKSRFNMSKNAFKRAAGKLYKNKKIIISDREIRLAENSPETDA